MHHFHFPARREGIRDDFSGPFQVQSPPVPNSEERVARPDVADDETCTARMELPLQYEVRERERDGVGKFAIFYDPAATCAGPGVRSMTATQRSAFPVQ
jgi:hypothetical protein